MRNPDRFTTVTVTDPAAITRMRDEVRSDGIAVSVQGFSVGVHGLAAPVIRQQWMCRFPCPDGMVRSFFTLGGSDSVEVALRLARQYHKLRGEAGRVK